MPQNDSLLTPDRSTRLILDVGEAAVQVRPEWHVRRNGDAIIRVAKAGGNASANVALQPGGGWTLAPHQDDLTRVVTTGYSATVLGAADVNLAANWAAINEYRKPTDLTGVGASGSLISSGIPAFTKQIPAGGTWNTELTSDLGALPKPAETTEDVPLNRVLSSRKTYAENAGFALLFSLPPDFTGTDTILRLYFGGPTATLTPGTRGGQFCVTLRGNGEAILREYDGGAWQVRKRFAWVSGQVPRVGLGVLQVLPVGRDTLAFRTMDSTPIFSAGGGAFLPLLTAIASTAISAASVQRGQAFYRTTKAKAGYMPGLFMTGAGQVRLDVRRDLRSLITLVHLAPPASGVLVDAPFMIPYPVPADTYLTANATAYTPKDSGLSVTMYDADTHAALTPVAANRWKSVAGQQRYYCKFSFTPDTAVEQTPVLWGYTAQAAPGALVSRGGAAVVAFPRSISVTGPDLDPTHDSASLHLDDPNNVLSILRTRSRIHSRVGIYTGAGDLLSWLFEGEVQEADATLKGKADIGYPDANYYEFDVTLTGMWARLADQVNFTNRNYDTDPTAAVDPATGVQPAPRITSVIKDLLGAAGFPASMIGVPDIDIRLALSAKGAQDTFILQPGMSIGDFVIKLTRDYLGSVLTWCPNSGAAGMWRLLPNPGPVPTNFLASFLAGPVNPAALPLHPSSYAAGTAPILGDRSGKSSLRVKVSPPECNFVLVMGTEGAPDDAYAAHIAYSMYNPSSFDFTGPTSDPTSPDYLGRIVPAVVVDTSLQTAAAVAFACRRIYDLAAHAQKWFKFEAPLLLVTDPADPYQTRPRPLRVNDAIYVLGVPCVVRSCNPGWSGGGADGAQRCYIEALALA